jgi:hypothetical protein
MQSAKNDKSPKGKKLGRPPLDEFLVERIKDLGAAHIPPKEIRIIVKKEFRQEVALRSVQRYAAQGRPKAGTDAERQAWSMMDWDGTDPDLPALYREVVQRRAGGVPPTRGEMAAAGRVLRLAPGLALWTAFKAAVAYQRRGTEPTADLDAFVSFQPWRSVKAYQDFEAWVKVNHPSWLKEATINPRQLTWLRVGFQPVVWENRPTADLHIPAKEGVWLALDGLCATEGLLWFRQAVEAQDVGLAVNDALRAARQRLEGEPEGSEEEPNGG